MKYYTSRKACEVLGTHPNTLRRWEKEGKIQVIKTSYGHRRYDVDGFLGNQEKAAQICYCRVSSHRQTNDLNRQVEYMREKYPQAEVIKDIGSGLNFKRKGLNSILERCYNGEKLEVVVAHRDRLARFGIEIIRSAIEFNGGKLVVLEQTLYSPEKELINDILSIIHVFSCRLYGLRNYKKQINQALSKQDSA